MPTTAQTYVTTSDTLYSELVRLRRAEMLSWRAIAQIPPFAPLPAGTLCTWYKTGNLPRRWYSHFGLTAYAPAPVCPAHGIVHCYDCTAEQVKPLPKPSKPRARRAINLADPVSAAATIINHAAPAYIARLVELLDVCAEPTATPKELHT